MGYELEHSTEFHRDVVQCPGSWLELYRNRAIWRRNNGSFFTLKGWTRSSARIHIDPASAGDISKALSQFATYCSNKDGWVKVVGKILGVVNNLAYNDDHSADIHFYPGSITLKNPPLEIPVTVLDPVAAVVLASFRDVPPPPPAPTDSERAVGIVNSLAEAYTSKNWDAVKMINPSEAKISPTRFEEARHYTGDSRYGNLTRASSRVIGDPVLAADGRWVIKGAWVLLLDGTKPTTVIAGTIWTVDLPSNTLTQRLMMKPTGGGLIERSIDGTLPEADWDAQARSLTAGI